MADIQTKYQKLAAEYSKLRAQIPVLKKAVLDEQAKTEELEESLKEKDKSVRKYEQELESLMFRNQQLSSRVSVLQQELDKTEAKSKKNKKHPQYHGVDGNTHYPEFMSHSSVIGEELQNKIEENERLHKQVHEASLQYEQTVGELQEKLMLLEAETSHHQEALNAAMEKSRSQISKLEQDKAALEAKLQKQERESKELLERAVEADSKLHTVQEDLTSKLQAADRVIQCKLAFNDSENKTLNSLNIPAHNRSEQLHIQELVGQAARLIKELVQGLSNYYTYSEQRSKIYPVDSDVDTLSDVNKKYCQYLHENTQYLRPVEQTFTAFRDSLKDDVLVTLETASGLTDFAAAFKRYVSYASKLLPYQLLSLEEESSVSSCPASLESSNKELADGLKKFLTTLSKLETYINTIATQSDIFSNHPRSSHFKMFEVLTSAVSEFHQATRELSCHYAAKTSIESQLPTVSQKLRVTGECIVSSLNSLMTCTSKLSAFMAGNLDWIKEMLDSRTSGLSAVLSDHTHPYVNTYRQRAAEYMNLISRPCPQSVPYTTALNNRKTLLSSTESRDTLSQQVAGYQEKICKLEQEKEHWLLESQLTEMKYTKECQKVNELEQKVRLLEAKLSGSIEDNLENASLAMRPDPVGSISKPTGSTSTLTDKSMLGSVECVSTGEVDCDTREQLIRQHFSNRINELTLELQTADSKALYFHAECRALHKQLNLCQKENELVHKELRDAKQSQAQLKDELQTTTRSYEGQLSMMSEHLAAINEKLTSQKDEIDMLKYQLNNCNKTNKKGRLK